MTQDNSFQATKDGFDFLLARLPFDVVELHPDNGAEFINQLLYRHWHTLVPKLQVSRSKPYHNFFLPVMHLKQKQVTSQHTLLRVHDQALTSPLIVS